MKLHRIERDCRLPNGVSSNEHLDMMLKMTGASYDSVGYEEPWVGYLAVSDDAVLGFCGFKSPPAEGKVEIAYATMPGNEGQGIATEMARNLIKIAESHEDSPLVIAQTLPETNASTSILKKLDFQNVGSVEHPEDGTVWQWERHRDRQSNG